MGSNFTIIDCDPSKGVILQLQVTIICWVKPYFGYFFSSKNPIKGNPRTFRLTTYSSQTFCLFMIIAEHLAIDFACFLFVFNRIAKFGLKAETSCNQMVTKCSFNWLNNPIKYFFSFTETSKNYILNVGPARGKRFFAPGSKFCEDFLRCFFKNR